MTRRAPIAVPADLRVGESIHTYKLRTTPVAGHMAFNESGERPERVGVYQILCDAQGLLYQHWNGLHWGLQSSTVKLAMLNAGRLSLYQYPMWRGLTQMAHAYKLAELARAEL